MRSGSARDAAERLVIVSLRGGLDGLSAVVPCGDDDYHRARPTLGIRRGVLPLDDHFGLHPALRPLLGAYREGTLAIVHAVGGPAGTTHSHFQARDEIETGFGAERLVQTGWLARWLGAVAGSVPLPAIAFAPAMPRLLWGAVGASVARDLDDLLDGELPDEAVLRALYEKTDLPVGPAALSSLDARRALHGARIETSARDRYPRTPFGRQLADTAAILRADLGVRAICLELAGFDTHTDQGRESGRLADLLAELAQGLEAFLADLGHGLRSTAVIVLSEFGRRVGENGGGGTDHGQGGLFLLAGNGIRGGRVLGRWPTLAPSALVGPGDLAATTDFRDVLVEVGGQRVLPDHRPHPVGLFATG